MRKRVGKTTVNTLVWIEGTYYRISNSFIYIYIHILSLWFIFPCVMEVLFPVSIAFSYSSVQHFQYLFCMVTWKLRKSGHVDLMSFIMYTYMLKVFWIHIQTSPYHPFNHTKIVLCSSHQLFFSFEFSLRKKDNKYNHPMKPQTQLFFFFLCFYFHWIIWFL